LEHFIPFSTKYRFSNIVSTKKNVLAVENAQRFVVCR